MIVQCPSCSKRYRVDDANIPPSGGKIRCPACSHSFVVYPDSESESPDPAPGEKTQVAQRPNMDELLKGMQQGQGDGGGQEQEETAKTEVMSGSELPDFNNLFGQESGGEDATMEVPNPLHSGGGDAGNPSPTEDDLATQEIDPSTARDSLEKAREIADSNPPVEDPGGGDDAATQITPPSSLGDIPAPQNSQRAQAPDGPTPPPGQNPRPQSESPGSSPGGGRGSSPGGGHGSSPGGGRGSSPGGGHSSSPGVGHGSSPGGGHGSSPGGGPGSSPGGGHGSSPGGGPGSSPGMNTPSAQGPGGGSPSQQAGADATHDGPWKLKTNYGLTYEFADNDSLREWLEGRDELDGYELSAGDDDFHPLEDFPQIQGGGAGANASADSGAGCQMPSSGSQAPMPSRGDASSGPVGAQQSSPQSPSSGPARTPSSPGGSGPVPPPGGAGGGGNAPGGGHSPFQTAAQPSVGGGQPQGNQPGGQASPQSQKEKINPNEKFEPPSRDSGVLNFVLWGAFFVLMIAAVVLVLGLFDVISLPFLDEEAEPETDLAVQQEEMDDDELEEMEEIAEEEGQEAAADQIAVDRLLEDAREDMDSNRLGSALEHLEEAQNLDAERIELYEMKAELHEDLGDGDKADAMREQAEQLAQQQQADDDGEETPSEEQEDE